MKFQKMLLFVLISAVFLNAVHASASASVITTFNIVDDFDTAYDFETYPDKFAASEITSETLGTVHRLTWKNPKDLAENMQVEIYACVEFEVYAPKDFYSKFYTTWAQIEASSSRDWLVVDSPYTKVYEGSVSETSCDVDFNKLLKNIEDYCTNSDSSTSVGDGDSLNSSLRENIANRNLIHVLADWVSSKLGGESLSSEICLYTYTVNNMQTAEFKFSKMKYYIRYKEPVMGEEPLQEDGLYHYYFDGWQYLWSPPGKTLGGVSEMGAYTVSCTLADEGENADGSGRYHVSYRVVSEYPLCFVLDSRMKNSFSANENVYDNASKRFRGFDLRPYGLTNGGTHVNKCGIFFAYTLFDCVCDGSNSGSVPEIVPGALTDYRGELTYQDSLVFMCSHAAFDTNIPIFSPVFDSAYEDYLFSGELEAGEAGNSWMLPSSGFLYGQLLQNTVDFADGSSSLDGSGSTTSVLDGNNDTDNGWLKKIYYLLKDSLLNGDGDSWLAKIHKRLEWTNTYLKALIAENTIADAGSFVLDFLGEKIEGVAETLLDGVAASGVTAAGETITAAASTRFPFSIYMDYAVLAAAFSADPATPVFTIPFRVGKRGDGWLIDEKLDVDLSRFDGLAKVSRGMFYCLFIAGLVPATRKYVDMINGGKLL